MKMLFISRLYVPHIGGVEKHVAKVTEQLIKLGHKVTIITEQHDKKLLTVEKYKGVEIYRIPVYNIVETKKKWVVWKWLWENKAIWQEADTLHVHDVFFWIIPFRVLGMTPPVYTTFHGWEGTYPPNRSARVQKQLAQSWSKKTISVGNYIGKWYGINPDVITYGASDGKKLPSIEENVVVVLGRLSKDNDMDLVLAGLKQLKNIKVIFVGDGELRIECEKLGKVTGMVKDVEEYLQTAKVVVSSSYLSILDSLRAGKSVVSIYSNPLKKDYLVGSPMAKYIKIVNSADELARVVKKAMDEKVDEKAIEWAVDQTWDKVTKSYLKLWQS